MTSSPHSALQPATNAGSATPAILASPSAESVRAIEDTRRLLEEAITALDAGGDEQAAHAYARAAECADHIARALWFLRRLEREQVSAS